MHSLPKPIDEPYETSHYRAWHGVPETGGTTTIYQRPDRWVGVYFTGPSRFADLNAYRAKHGGEPIHRKGRRMAILRYFY